MISAQEYLRVLYKNFLPILLAAICGALIGLYAIHMAPTKYTTEALLTVQANSLPDVAGISNSTSLTVAEASALAAVSGLQATHQDALARGGLSDLDGNKLLAKAEVVPGTSVLHLTITGPSASEATQYTDALVLAIISYGQRLSPKTATGLEAVSVAPVAPASIPQESKPMSPILATLAGALAAALFAYVSFLLHAIAARRLHTGEDLRELVGQAYMGEVTGTLDSNAFADGVQTAIARLGWATKAQLGYAVVIARVGSDGGEQTATEILGLAAAAVGRSVLIVEAPPARRTPASARRRTFSASAQLSESISHKGFVQAALEPGGNLPIAAPRDIGVDTMSAGGSSDMVLSAARSDGAKILLASLRERYDLILIDATDRAPLSRLLALSDLTGHALIVVGRDNVNGSDVIDMLDAMPSELSPAFISWSEPKRN